MRTLIAALKALLQHMQGWVIQLMLSQVVDNAREFSASAGQFDPWRWLEANGRGVRREPRGYIPWGDGPRKCLGMVLARAEMRVSTIDSSVYMCAEGWAARTRPAWTLPGSYVPFLAKMLKLA